MFRALVVASALLTATLAAVLFMPGIGRNSAAAESETTGEMLRSGGLTAGADAPVQPVAEIATQEAPEVVAEAEPAVDPEPVKEAAPEVIALAEVAGPLADENALAMAVALSAPAQEDAAAEDALASMAVVQPEDAQAAAPGETGVEALSLNVLAGLGHQMPQEPEAPVEEMKLASTEPLVRVERGMSARASSNRAMKEAASWTTDYVLIGLGQGPRKVTSPLEDAQEWSTAYVLNGLGSVAAADQGETGPVALEDVIAKALEEGKSDASLIALIEELSAAGKLDAPAALLRPDGQVDTALVLNALVSASTAKAEAEKRAAAGDTTPAPIRRPVAKRLKQPVTYTVKRGDSLAAIAFRFYGVTSRYTMIFDANREALLSPDKIRAGQRLTIPAG